MAANDTIDNLTVCKPAGFYIYTMESQHPDAGNKNIAEGLFSHFIKNLVKQCRFDEVQKIVGPFMQKWTQLLENLHRRHVSGIQTVAVDNFGISREEVDNMVVLNAKQNS